MLKVNDLTVLSHDEEKKLLDDVSFAVGEKEIHTILGKNGSGKSTLAYALMGLDRYKYTRGQITFEGKEIGNKAPHQRAKAGITLAFQEPARFEGIRVIDFLRAGRKKATKEEMIDVLKLVGLNDEEFLERNLDDKLSGGERKRIELASIIIMKPKLMLLDEPDASLDIIVYNELYDLLQRVRQSIGCSIVLITHREEAGLIADKATLLEGGKVVASGTFRRVMRQYCKREGKRETCMAYKMANLKKQTGK